MNLTPLKYLLIIENSTCIFRNYYSFKKCARILIGCWVFIEIFNVALSLVSYVQHNSDLKLNAQRIYFFSVTGFSIYVILSSVYYAKRFYQLLFNFDAFHNLFDDVFYSRILLKAQKCLTIMVVILCSLKIIVFAYLRMVHIENDMGSIAATLVQYNIIICEFRYIYQYFIVHSILFVISEQLNAITRSIDRDISAVRGAEDTVHGDDVISIPVEQDRLKRIDIWMSAYKNVNDSSNLCNAIFSVQVYTSTEIMWIISLYVIKYLISINFF